MGHTIQERPDAAQVAHVYSAPMNMTHDIQEVRRQRDEERKSKEWYRFLFWVALAIAIFNIFIAADNAQAAQRWQVAGTATWYGPGFYGNRTACGQRYHKNLPGVASNRLRCGTLVEMRYRGVRVTVPVIDTGGFTHTFDLSAWTARKLCGCRRPYTIHGLPYRVLK